jgi:proteasome accessory factor A
VFLENGARLYLDVGSHPEYATPECDSIEDVVAHDKAGERILEGLVTGAEERLEEEGIRGEIYVFKNNTDSAGNSYGCHENYLVSRHKDFHRTVDVLIPFLVTRQIFLGAGKLTQTPRGTAFSISQRADHIWEGVSSATTRSRPIINTRDEPHADAEKYRRLHVIAGDSNMSEYATFVKIGTMVALLQMIERDVIFRDLTLENPIRAIREVSHDITCLRKIKLANGRELSALDIQWEYLDRVMRFSRSPGFPTEVQRAIDRWEHVLTGLEKDPMTLHREVDWVMKYRLMERYSDVRGLAMSDPRISMMDLAYHDVDRSRGLYYLLENKGLTDRVVTDEIVADAVVKAPQTTRAKLRGAFIKAAKAHKRDFTVDWVHLKLNDQAQRTVMCKDPFKSEDERVDKLIESL